MAWWNRKKNAKPDVTIRVGAVSDVGRTRSENEDTYGHFPDPPEGDASDRLFVVADGMGGHSRGREASTTAVAVLQRTYFATRDEPVATRLEQAFRAANEAVYDLADAAGTGETMGTTGTALALVDGRAYLAHVGDSRAYRIGEADGEQLTRDHTMVAEMQREGVITAQEAQTHPRRGALTRALGTEPHVEVDVIDVGAVQRGDRFLLCTDGLADLPADEVMEAVRERDPQAACEYLVQRANEQGGYDNATALIVYITKG
ncbi:MAG: serine/threonine protein phosphatase [Bacteroidetes bacterium]|jgi:protein phosphatase|nr:serine/threonine protein phosphatase [Bacteroidota bacterium]